jgi:uncharacterized protein (DUF2336 family)
LSSNRQNIEAEVLFALAREKTQAGREQLFSSVAQLFELSGSRLSDRERALMRDILRRLSHEVEMSIRQKLAERLANTPSAPRDLVVLLANDRIEVAHPLLVQSSALEEPDLIEIVHARSVQHSLAIAVRSDIKAALSDALIATGNEDVIVALLNNNDAVLSSAAMDHLVAESERVDRYQQPLLRRGDLPPELARKMYAWVSESLRSYIVQTFDMDAAQLDAMLGGARDQALGEAVTSGDPSQRLVDKLHAAGELGPSFLLKTLTKGEIALFELAFAKLTGLTPALMRRIIYEPTGEGLAMACKSVGIDRSVFTTMLRLTRKAKEQSDALTPEQMARIQDMFDTLSRMGADLVLRHWARDPSYLDTLRTQKPN